MSGTFGSALQAKLNWNSLRTRLAIGVLCSTLISLWVVTLFISRYLRQDMEAAISSQQYSTVSLIAAELDRSVKERQTALALTAKSIETSSLRIDNSLEDFLEKQSGLLSLFNWGVIILDNQGFRWPMFPPGGDELAPGMTIWIFSKRSGQRENRLSPNPWLAKAQAFMS